MSWYPLLLLVFALLMFGYAGYALARDARAGYDVSMGGANLYAGSWVIGAFCGAAGLALLSGLRAGAGLGLFALAFVALYALRNPVYRIVVARNLGHEAPPLPRNGFKEYLRRAEQAGEKPDPPPS